MKAWLTNEAAAAHLHLRSSLQRGVDPSASVAQAGAAAPSASAAAAAATIVTAAENQSARAASSSSSLAARPQSLQHSIVEYGSRPDEFAQLRRTMTRMAQELTLLKPQTAADDDTTEALATLVKQAEYLRQLPAPRRTFLNADICNLYKRFCGKLQLKR